MKVSRGRAKPKARVRILRLDGDSALPRYDTVAGEEPLQIRLFAGEHRVPLATTMRTPGNDLELAAGFLRSEGIISSREDIDALRYCLDVEEDERYNVVDVHLRRTELPNLERLERYVTISSACGVCGKAHLEGIHVPVAHREATPTELQVSSGTLSRTFQALREQQALFEATGGLHAAGLFTTSGDTLTVREDVGRHNALDKALGWALLENVDLTRSIVCVSGRASFELLQKTVTSGARIFAAVSAPSKLAIDVARHYGVTLVGFLRDGRMNVYSGFERIEIVGDGLA